MIQRSAALVLLLISMVCVHTGFAEADEGDTQKATVITVSEFIQSVCKNSHFEEILLDELSLTYNEMLKIPYSDWILALKGGYTVTYEEDFSHGMELDASLSKLFTDSATGLSVSYRISPPVSPFTQYSSRMSLGIDQAIVQNAFGKTNSMKKAIAGIEREVAQYQIVEAYEEYLAALIAFYYRWYLGYENVMNAELSLKDSMELLNNIKEKFRFKVASQNDINKSTLQVLAKQETLLKTRQDYEELALQIKEAMGLLHDGHTFQPAFRALEINPAELEKNLGTFKNESRTSHILDQINKVNEINKTIAFDDLLPSASLYATYTISGDEYVFYPNTQHEVSIGIDFKLPFPKTQSESAYKIKELHIRKSILNSQNKIIQLERDLRILLKSMQYQVQMIGLAENKIRLAEDIVREEEKNYRNGKTDLNSLISAYNTLESNRYSKNNLEVLLHLSYIQWLRVTDCLVNEKKEIMFDAGGEK
jgi:outer membrane protein TolC